MAGRTRLGIVLVLESMRRLQDTVLMVSIVESSITTCLTRSRLCAVSVVASPLSCPVRGKSPNAAASLRLTQSLASSRRSCTEDS